MRGLGIVLGAAVLAWVVLAGPAMMLGGAGPEVTVPALLVCLAPNLLALGAVELARARGQTVQTGVEGDTEFHIVKTGGWPKGKYTVHVMADGKEVKTKDVTVK